MRTLAIDLSHHNGKWHPNKMDPNISLVINKATEGTTYKDSSYRVNKAKCPDHVTWGAYHLLRETSAMDTQAENFLITALLEEGDISALDLETKWIKAMVNKWGVQDTRDNINEWLEIVTLALDRKPLIYISERGVKHLGYTATTFKPAYPVWWVEYHTSSWAIDRALKQRFDPKSNYWELWQITSSAHPDFGGVSSSKLDVNIIRDADFLKPSPSQWSYDPDLDFFLPSI